MQGFQVVDRERRMCDDDDDCQTRHNTTPFVAFIRKHLLERQQPENVGNRRVGSAAHS